MIAIEELYGDACRLVQCLHVKQEEPHLKFSCTGTVGKKVGMHGTAMVTLL
jgi:hypothetical protein